MKTLSRLSLSVALVGAALGFALLPASAAPFAPVAPTTLNAAAAPAIENVAWVCGPYRCFHRHGPAYWRPRPVFAPQPFYAPRPYYGRRAFYGHPHPGYGYGRPHYGW